MYIFLITFLFHSWDPVLELKFFSLMKVTARNYNTLQGIEYKLAVPQILCLTVRHRVFLNRLNWICPVTSNSTCFMLYTNDEESHLQYYAMSLSLFILYSCHWTCKQLSGICISSYKFRSSLQYWTGMVKYMPKQ